MYIYSIAQINNDFGVTWTQSTNAPKANWRTVTSSADGQRLVAGSSSASDTGQFVAAVTNNYSYPYISSDYGMSWTITTAKKSTYYSIASDSTGKYLFAGSSDFVTYTHDFGVTWQSASPIVLRLEADAAYTVPVACDDTGSTGQFIYASNDYGVSWTKTSSGYGCWQCLASDSTGHHLVSGTRCGTGVDGYYGSLYTSDTMPLPTFVPTIAPSTPTSQPSSNPTQPTSQPSSQPSSVPSCGVGANHHFGRSLHTLSGGVIFVDSGSHIM
eukprot:gene25760-32249_t